MLWQQLNAPPTVGQAEYTGLVGVLVAGLVTLWRAFVRKDEQLQTLTKEMITHTDSLNQIPPALDRLRTEVTAKLERLQSE